LEEQSCASANSRRETNGDLDAKAVDALVEAQSMPAGSERTEALAKAEKLRYAAEVYNYLFSSELKPPD
jgi:hypothetical protein